ncbi:hypothetical protein LJK87_34750 [Paenibacillus sp. P25]|nr:hypothetical protein LJK87_34750 [Paenibacillus sp. P25]
MEGSDLSADKDKDGTPFTKVNVSKEKLTAALDKLKGRPADQQRLVLEAKNGDWGCPLQPARRCRECCAGPHSIGCPPFQDRGHGIRGAARLV